MSRKNRTVLMLVTTDSDTKVSQSPELLNKLINHMREKGYIVTCAHTETSVSRRELEQLNLPSFTKVCMTCHITEDDKKFRDLVKEVGGDKVVYVVASGLPTTSECVVLLPDKMSVRPVVAVFA